ncbi:methyl-accepting chemotaxis protein [Bowmanella yangjiangensis]|uniref:Methyl-accepting chemotaxis protein n=1 Tax=Bowmanella yangjiangensis TaxID=2811230 RepID=A0ABS3CND1_9ALTE|nr:methyl-accepting chemotaxis protein [Bowmanella yangjiangensis]MBN7818613.1 methyl-accepting chemotaxis protein [Bowmanella yangjiangensis]
MLNQVTVKVRLMILVALPLFFFALSAFNSLQDLRQLNQQIDSLYKDRVVPLQQIKVVSDNYAVEIVDILHKYRAGVISKDELSRRMQVAQDTADKQWQEYKSTKLTNEEEQLVRQIESNLNTVLAKLTDYRRLLAQGSLSSVDPNGFVRELYQAFDPLSASYASLIQLQLDEANKFRQQVADDYETTVTLFLIKIAVLFLLMLVIAWLIYRSINSPLLGLRDTITRIADSADLSVRACVVGQDEIAQTAEGFNNMLERIHTLVKEVIQASTTLAASAEEMHAISTQVASTANEQEHQSTQIATAVTEMTAAIQEVAQNALLTSQKANDADEQAQLGQQKVQQNIHSINQLSGAVNRSSEVIQQLHSQANDINQVVQLIQNVAEQTNLLALNAAIEAARAGDSGRGFAVVADEVRQLAHNTQKATESISEMIGKLQVAAKDAVESMSQAQQMATDSVNHAEDSSQVLKDIIASLTVIADMNIQVSTATEEQTTVANEISANVNDFSTSIASVTDSSNQNAQASDDLSRLAVNLQGQVSVFRI